VIEQIDFDGAELSDYGLYSDGEDQVDDFERGPEDFTLYSEMEEFTDCELNFLLIVFSRYFSLQVFLISQFYRIISSEQKNYVLH
jgi:hypothetical protein